MARIAEVGGRFEDCVEFIIDMIRKKDEQTVKVEYVSKPIAADYTRAERNLIRVGFKNVIGRKRVLARIVESTCDNPKYQKYKRRLRQYQNKLKEEIIGDCKYFIDMLHSYCVDRTGNGVESEVFFLTQVADLTRYICEQTEAGPKLKDVKDSAITYYERAGRKAEKLHYCSPIKMSRDLHHANFLFEHMSDPAGAIKLCDLSLVQCQAQISTADEETYVEATHIMELLKEN